MNYELAKELKDVGFPIIEHADRAPEPRHYFLTHNGKLVDPVYVPTLEELVEACGDDFRAIHSPQDMNTEMWIAGGMNKSFVEGRTPTEAVARLWLALNKK